jgi:hypothetical protein
MKKGLKWGFVVENGCRKTINEIASDLESVIPKRKWNTSMIE